MISEFNYLESDRAVFEQEFASRLPDVIFDNHIHCWSKECLNISRSDYALYKDYKPWTDFDFIEEFTIDDYLACVGEIFPGRKCQAAYFGLPFPQIDRDRSNAYIAKRATEIGAGFYYMPGQFEDMDEADQRHRLLDNPYFIGLKPYPDLVAGGGGDASIYDMLNRSALEFANRHSLPVILHLPRKGRLHDERNRLELEEILTNYPDIRMIVAHFGRAFCYADAVGVLDFLAKYENAWFDTAFVDDPQVYEYVMRLVPSEKILYGSDAPLALTRGKDVVINNKHYYVAGHTVPWGLGPMKEGFVDLTYYVYEQIRAMLYAAANVYGRNEERHIENIFHMNAMRVLGEKGKIYA